VEKLIFEINNFIKQLQSKVFMHNLFSRIIKRRVFSRDSANTAREVIHAQEMRKRNQHTEKVGSPFVIKYLREPIAKVRDWQVMANQLSALKVPTAGYADIIETRRGVAVKQRDYSSSLKRKIFEARDQELRNHPDLIMSIVGDIARMHKGGFSLGSQEYMLTPWLIYQKANGKFERVLADFGSLSHHKSTHRKMPGETGKDRPYAEADFNHLLPFLRSIGNNFAIRAMEHYFSINPEPQLKSKASTFLGPSF
jgi:hypothetical protein